MLSQFVKHMTDSFLQDKEGVMNRMPPPAWMSSNPRQDIKPQSVTYSRLHPTARPYTAVVSPPGGESAASTKYNLQQAINFCHTLGFGRIFIKNGTYVIGSNLTMYSNIQIIGEDRDNTIFDFNNGTNYFDCLGTLANFGFSGITIQNYGGTQAPILVQKSDGFSVIGCNFFNNGTTSAAASDIIIGTDSTNSVNTRITYNESFHAGHFVSGTGVGGDGLVGWNDISFAKGNVFVGNNGLITGNNMSFCEAGLLSGNINFCRFIGNSYFDSGTSTVTAGALINPSSSGNFIIGNNEFQINRSDGRSAMTLGTCSDFSVSGNSFYTPGNMIRLIASFDGAITGNFLQQNGGSTDGIYLTGACNHNAITGNRIAGAGTGTAYAVNISGTAVQNTVVVGNSLTANTAGVNDAGTGGTVTANA